LEISFEKECVDMGIGAGAKLMLVTTGVGLTRTNLAMTSEQVERRALELSCDEYLSGLHCVLWGQAFVVTGGKDRQQAVYWLADQIEGVAKARA
jgi:hypothetical protein